MLAPSKLVKSSVSSVSQKSFKPNLLKRKKLKKVTTSQVEEEIPSEPIEQQEVITEETTLIPEKIVETIQVTPVTGNVINPPTIEQVLPQTEEEPTEISLAQLIDDDFKDGRLSTREIQRREKMREKRMNRNKQEVPVTPTIVTPVEVTQSQPKLILVDGKMVLDQESIQVRNEVVTHEGNIIEEDASNRYVTSLSFRNKRKLPNTRWTRQMTARFYLGLSYFGTDFKLISYMFPGLTHKAIKMKFKAEEKKCEWEVSRALRERIKAPEDIRRRMLDGVKGKRILEDGMYVQSRLDTGQEEEKPKAIKVQPTESEPEPEPEPETNTIKRLETVVEEDEQPTVIPVIPTKLEIKTKKVVSGMVAKGIKRKKKKVVSSGEGETDAIPNGDSPVEVE